MNEHQGQRDGHGRAEVVNRAEGDSNPFDHPHDELLEMTVEHSFYGLSRGSFVRAFSGGHDTAVSIWSNC